jgi:hypothetical protein
LARPGLGERNRKPDHSLSEPGIAGDAGVVDEEATVELGSWWLDLAVTHREALSWRRETSVSPGKPEGFAQVLCQFQGFIWEIRDNRSALNEV